MMLGSHTVTRLRAATDTDPYSEESAPDWTQDPGELDQDGCSVQPGPPKPELRDAREGVVIDFTVWAPLDFDVTEVDRIRWQGNVYLIADTIQRWDFSGLGHLVVPIKRVEG